MAHSAELGALETVSPWCGSDEVEHLIDVLLDFPICLWTLEYKTRGDLGLISFRIYLNLDPVRFIDRMDLQFDALSFFDANLGGTEFVFLRSDFNDPWWTRLRRS